MTDENIKELYRIIEMEGLSRSHGAEARRKLLDDWVSNNIQTFILEQSVLKDNLTSEEEDFLKERLATDIAHYLLENNALVIKEKQKVKVQVNLLKRNFPKNIKR